ncbi:DoxX family protein [Natrialbaceae archaeon A-gly3]
MSTKPVERTLEVDLLGTEVSLDYSETWVGYSLLSLRLVMAYVFLSAGIQKVLDPEWTAEGFLVGAVADANPFAGLWTAMAEGWLWLIDPLNVWGQVLIGLALFAGVFVRFAAFGGALMMLLYWLTQFEGGLFAGLPVANGYFVTYHLVYALLLFGVGAFGAGRILGLDEKLEETSFVQQNSWLRYLLG